MVNILIGATGSVATIKLLELVNEVQLKIRNVQIKIIVTENARRFMSDEWTSVMQTLQDKDEWSAWKHRGDPVLHIEVPSWWDFDNFVGSFESGLISFL